jgi:hypothetical protein
MRAVPALQIEVVACGAVYAAVLVVTVLLALFSRRAERRKDALRILTILFGTRHRD